MVTSFAAPVIITNPNMIGMSRIALMQNNIFQGPTMTQSLFASAPPSKFMGDGMAGQMRWALPKIHVLNVSPSPPPCPRDLPPSFGESTRYYAPGYVSFAKFNLPGDSYQEHLLPGRNESGHDGDEYIEPGRNENIQDPIPNGDVTFNVHASQGGPMKRDFREIFGGKPPIDEEELVRLTDEQLALLLRNHEEGIITNGTFNRSNHYPLPRDLSFPAEKPLFRKWAEGREKLVEIGVFEGASALAFRRVMSRDGTLHLIDPFVVVPDSGLTARSWMARLNVLRSGNGNVKWHKDYSDNVAKNWREPVDFLFIDGDHSERACRSDWDHWHSFIAVNGVVLFHDARFGKGDGKSWDGWPGPSNVVDQLFRGPKKLENWEIVDETGSAVVVKRIR